MFIVFNMFFASSRNSRHNRQLLKESGKCVLRYSFISFGFEHGGENAVIERYKPHNLRTCNMLDD